MLGLGSRGAFEAHVQELALLQLQEVVAKGIYSSMEPENPGLRPSEIVRKEYSAIAKVLAERIARIQSDTQDFRQEDWETKFVSACEAKDAELRELWKEEWVKRCSGKRLIDDIYREYKIKKSKFDFKRALARRMKNDQSEDWTLVRSKLRDAMN